MPLYEYECTKCGHRFEKIQKFSDKHIKKCPECGGPLEQLVHAPAVQFKGSGWYVTDYAKKPHATDAAKDTSRKEEKKTETPAKESKKADKHK